MPNKQPFDHNDSLSRRGFLGILAAVSLYTLLPPASSASLIRINEPAMRDFMARHYGTEGQRVLNKWFALLDNARPNAEIEQLQMVNDYFNREVRWVDDFYNWGEADFWATPLETLAKGQGDCEDYSIGKYISLLLLGVPNAKLRLIYVQAQLAGRSQAHMVLGYYSSPTSEPLILDNINPRLMPSSLRTDLSPVFSFNIQGLWIGGSQESAADPTARLSRWRNVLTRMRAEGFVL